MQGRNRQIAPVGRNILGCDIREKPEFAEKLAAIGETDRISHAHARYFIDLLEDIPIESSSAPTGDRFLPHAEHLANVRAALDWSFSERGDRGIGVDLATASAHFFLELSLLTECYRWTQQALAFLDKDSLDPRQEMELQAAHGVSVMFTQGNTEAVRSAFTRSLALAQSLEDLHWQLWLLRGLHIFLTRIGDFRGALRVGEQGISVARTLNDPAGMLNVEWMLGVAHHLIGNQGKAVPLCESAMTENPSSQRLNILRLGYDDRIIALVAYAVTIYNNLVRVKRNVDQAWANIDVLLKQRHDEIPKLIDAVKGWVGVK